MPVFVPVFWGNTKLCPLFSNSLERSKKKDTLKVLLSFCFVVSVLVAVVLVVVVVAVVVVAVVVIVVVVVAIIVVVVIVEVVLL